MKLTVHHSLPFIALTSALLLTSPASAQTDVCKSEAMSDMQTCADQNLKQSEKALNAEYQKLVAVLKDKKATEVLKGLQAAENSWIRTRAADCDLYKMFYKCGSLAALGSSNCLDTAAKQRTQVLRGFYDEFSH